jgi:hypothetical protein
VGDFETWVDKRIRLRAFGVHFRRDDVRKMVPDAFSDDSDPTDVAETETVASIDRGGRRLSELWPDWVAELVALIHDEGSPEGTGSQGSDRIIAAIEERLAESGLACPARTTVQPTVSKVLRRLRAGN